MRKILHFALLAFAVAVMPVVAGEGADWVPAKVFFSWDWSMGGFCTMDDQCLVHLLGNPGFDGDLDRWYTRADPEFMPRCINNTQYLLDYYCDNSNWTTRTKLVALYLLRYAEGSSQSNFTLFCDSYERVLNKYGYLLEDVLAENYLAGNCEIAGVPGFPCINSVCVLKTQGVVALGASLNIPVNHSTMSFLAALGKSPGLCSSPQGAGFVKCSPSEPIWYNSEINSVIFLPGDALVSPDAGTALRIKNPLAALSSYVMSVLHVPNNPRMNFAYFPRTRLLNHLYLAQDAGKGVFGFLEKGMRPEYDPVPIDYIGVRYTGIDFIDAPNSTCLNIIKRFDSKAFCENQTGAGFNVVARQRCEPGDEDVCLGASPIVGAWPALAGKLRP